MFGFIFEIIVFIVIIRAFAASKKNAQRKQTSKKQKNGWQPTAEKAKPAVPNRPNLEKVATSAEASARTFVEPSRPYRAPHNAGERYEEWMPVPEGKKVCRCSYCAADNLIPKGADPSHYSCYFCREEL